MEYNSLAELLEILKSELLRENKFLQIGAGSNLLFMNDFKGVVLHSAIKSIEVISEDDHEIVLKVGSGYVWDDFVAYCVAKGWSGIENLSLIPGEVGASAVQNIGAYGVEVKDVIESVELLDVEDGVVRIFSNEQCHYGYRSSIFKNELKGKCIVVAVVFRLSKKEKFVLNYSHLEQQVAENGNVDLQNIRKTIIEIRQSKLPDTKDLGNAGSFFMNPVVGKEKFQELASFHPEMPHYYVSEKEEKLPAGWLIEQCGWKGKYIGMVGVHDKQALVLVNKGGASGLEIAALAGQVQQSVLEKFGVKLIPEVNYVY